MERLNCTVDEGYDALAAQAALTAQDIGRVALDVLERSLHLGW